MRAFVCCFLLPCSLLSITYMAEASESLSGFSVDLIHRDSPLSPFYKPSLTPSERMKNAAMRSIARSKRLALSRKENGFPRSVTTPDEAIGEYLMRFYIGTPPVERFAIADTGSDLIWVQCTPCMNCLPQETPLFDPRKSSTFRKVRCDSQPCTLLPHNQRGCGKSGECYYKYGYGDNSYNLGTLSVEKIKFGPTGVSVTFPKFTFGCAYYNNDTADSTKKNTGLVGLGAGPLSLVSQLSDIGKKFSYCLLPSDSNSTSKLKFGNDATIKGKGVVSTPLIFKSSSSSFYFLNLEGISVGNRFVETRKSQIDGNMIIDSGTTLTSLQKSFYRKFATLVKDALGGEAEKNPPMPYDLCYRDQDTTDNVPDVVFHFTGAKVRMKVINLFDRVDDEDSLICLLIQPTDEEDDLPVLGNRAQIGFQVEYDLDGGKISFAPADCAKH